MINALMIKLIRLYQKLISPFLPGGCRFYPTCSEYSAQALEKYNVPKALGLSLIRLLKCHPYHGGGSDPLK
ncbi:MAG TPA: membrane protein insertion efficiency factor YidD [Nitrospinaceae bacterium]|uniref:Membrane protein insertion efficiency factor YidD n=1 Tax=marine metagenome TaxID=408172 RepID=A0A381W9L8_9ZZZZ|nr:membrane protein insertion efficiency factor YidD [Nitrospinales bacterium]HIB43180.1 membrane protein insertion efficiency factor YidD [Nitrospina sp.]HIN88409.1 membrane protein insertion efficiency factor YidD [Nitrospinaceae bacterium]HIO23646.1 membrane protein insertion efficiency factor YidD [Nitrospinaceae bacterium]